MNTQNTKPLPPPEVPAQKVVQLPPELLPTNHAWKAYSFARPIPGIAPY